MSKKRNRKHTIQTTKRLIGRREEVDLPDWELYGMEAKVDTGAYTSSLHCHHIEEVSTGGEDGAMIRFNLLDPTHEAYNEKLFKLPIYDQRDVKSSNAQTERRYIVQTVMLLFNQEYTVELSLTDRSEMKYPVLLGRRFLRNKFIVDVSKVNLSKNIEAQE